MSFATTKHVDPLAGLSLFSVKKRALAPPSGGAKASLSVPSSRCASASSVGSRGSVDRISQGTCMSNASTKSKAEVVAAVHKKMVREPDVPVQRRGAFGNMTPRTAASIFHRVASSLAAPTSSSSKPSAPASTTTTVPPTSPLPTPHGVVRPALRPKLSSTVAASSPTPASAAKPTTTTVATPQAKSAAISAIPVPRAIVPVGARAMAATTLTTAAKSFGAPAPRTASACARASAMHCTAVKISGCMRSASTHAAPVGGASAPQSAAKTTQEVAAAESKATEAVAENPATVSAANPLTPTVAEAAASAVPAAVDAAVLSLATTSVPAAIAAVKASVVPLINLPTRPFVRPSLKPSTTAPNNKLSGASFVLHNPPKENAAVAAKGKVCAVASSISTTARNVLKPRAALNAVA